MLVLNSNSEKQIQDPLHSVKLSECQFELSNEIIPKLNESLTTFLFIDYLPYIIKKECRFLIKSN